MPMIDAVDRVLIDLLSENARLSLKQLAAESGLSSPATAERLRRLHERGVIRRFTVEIDHKALGFALEAIVRIRPLPARVHILEKLIRENPHIVECDKVTGDDCFVARVVVRSIEQIDTIMNEIADNAMSSTAIVKSQPVKRRLPPLG